MSRQRKQPQTETVTPGAWILREQALSLQRADQPVGGALMKSKPVADLGDAQLWLVTRESFQYGDCAFDRLRSGLFGHLAARMRGLDLGSAVHREGEALFVARAYWSDCGSKL